MHIVMHNAASVDGRIDGFVPDIGLYYGLAETWDVDAHLVGADTLIEGQQQAAPTAEDPTESATVTTEPEGAKPPLLVVTDSRGRVSEWEDITGQPFWREVLVLCAETTPVAYLRTLEDLDISVLTAGTDRVDLREATESLTARGIECVLVDSGGTLNGALLSQGLIDEVSVVIHPVAVGGTSARTFIRGPERPDGPTRLALIATEHPADDTVWLRYEVVK